MRADAFVPELLVLLLTYNEIKEDNGIPILNTTL
jgi:hypothetical protein